MYLTDEEFDKIYNEYVRNYFEHGLSRDCSPDDVVRIMKEDGYTRRSKIRVGTGKAYDFFGDIKWSWLIGIVVFIIGTCVVCLKR